MTLIEAMAAGLPVVATRVGGVAEVVEEGATGLLAPAGDADVVAAHLNALAENGGLRADMGRCGRRRAQELFSEDKMVGNYDRLYREMLAQGGHHG